MRRVTIKDIAQLAGVSYATVSRALNNAGEISEATRKRILDICAREGYRANVLARSLIAQKTHVLGLIVPNITNPFYSELALAIELHARSKGYNVMLCNGLHDSQLTKDLFDFLVGQQVDGVIFGSARNEDHDWIQRRQESIPLVLVGDAMSEENMQGINAISTDNRLGGRMAAEYLLGLGHRRITYFGLRPDSFSHEYRFQGFRQAIESSDSRADCRLSVVKNDASTSSMDRGYTLAKTMFQNGLEDTAVFAATDGMALGLLQAAGEFGIRVPEDLSLIGFDNIVYTSLPKIRLSTIDQQKHMLGTAAVDLLISLIRETEPGTYTRKLIRPQLVERESCRPVQTG